MPERFLWFLRSLMNGTLVCAVSYMRKDSEVVVRKPPTIVAFEGWPVLRYVPKYTIYPPTPKWGALLGAVRLDGERERC